MPLLQFENVSKVYSSDGQPVHALQDVNVQVDPGAFVVLLGPSGCGKSTLLHLAAALDFPSAGRVLLDGICTTGLADAELAALRRNKTGFVFQSFQLLNTLSVVENVELPLLLAGRGAARERALQLLSWVELDALATRLPHQLSGGQMQRVAIARALALNPSLLLADEPTGNLDSTTGEMILRLLGKINREQGATIVMATHSLESAAFAGTAIRLKDGRIEETNPA